VTPVAFRHIDPAAQSPFAAHWEWQSPKVQISPAAQSLFKAQATAGVGFAVLPPQPANSDAEKRNNPTTIERTETFILTSSP
jgi:hypothetical protein